MKNRLPDEPRRALVYARVSKVEMVNAEFCSLDGQEQRCRDYARALGWEVVGTFRDASTGGNMDRPSLKKLLAKVAEGSCNTLLVYKIDRLSRSVLDFWTLFEQLQGHGCDLVSVTERFDTSTPQGRLMLNILAGFGEFEREQIRERTKQGLRSRAAAGYWPIRHTPFGYDRKATGENGAPQTLEPNRDARWVVDVLKRYLAGDGPALIADDLNAAGVQAPNGRQWNGRLVTNMLRNVAYIGRVPWNGTTYEGKHDPIIDADLWASVQERLATGQRGQSRKPRTMSLEGVPGPALVGLVCDASGEPFRRYWSRGSSGKVTFYYEDPDTGQRINAAAFDCELLRALRATVVSPETFAGTLGAVRQETDRRAAELDDRVRGLTSRMAALESQEGRLVDAIAQGVAPERVKAKLEEIAEERKAIKAGLVECNGEREQVKAAAQDVDMFAHLRAFLDAADEGGDFLDVQAVLRALVRDVTVDLPRGRVLVALNLPAIAAQSIGENAAEPREVGSAPQHVVARTTEAPQDGAPDSKYEAGEGDGTRTHNHQIDSLVL